MMSPRRFSGLFLVCLFCVGLAGFARAQDELQVLARVGPWPVVSRLIAFQGEIWFANSVKGVNHNSAELYSYDPASGRVLYRRHLFSQDAGRPLVHQGRLYWPFEDARISLGWGEAAVTDGQGWDLLTIPSGRSFHTHAMSTLKGNLVAATSAWRAGFQVSGDGGRTWRQAYDHPTPEGRVSRITRLAALPGWVFGTLSLRGQQRLLRFDGASVTEVPGWPQGRTIRDLVAWRSWVYGLVSEPDGVALWRSDGAQSEPVTEAKADWRPRALAAGEGRLWSLTASAEGGLIHASEDGRDWTLRQSLSGGRAQELLIHRGRPYVGGTDSDGKGVLWGPPPEGREEVPTASGAAPERRPATLDPGNWQDLGTRLDRALAQAEAYAGHGGLLRDLVYEAALSGSPPDFFASRLAGVRPDRSLDLIGGATTSTPDQLSRWILLWGMALSGEGKVPVAMLRQPWSAAQNRAEKYFETAPAAIWAVSWIGQRDRATVEALIGRLDRPGDPDWLKGDLVGALTSLTGQGHGFDTEAWRRWWAETRQDWLY